METDLTAKLLQHITNKSQDDNKLLELFVFCRTTSWEIQKEFC